MLTVKHVSGGYASETVLQDVSFEVEKGELYGILGPNGSGKTTLLKMLSGILPVQQGDILINGKRLMEYGSKQLAQMIAVLSQHSSESFSYTVKETVSLGRYAHQKGWFQSWSKEDEIIVRRVMDQTGISTFQNRNIQELSGGEKQRVFLAQALAQEPKILLLDEPTNHLDLSYQKELLDLLKQWTRETGLTVISIFHDLNLAGLYCDRLLLLENGTININHIPNEVLREEKIRDVYHTEVLKHPHPKVAAPQMCLLPEGIKKDSIKIVDESMVGISSEFIVLRTPAPLRTMSSGVIGSGTGWHQNFVNRHVDKSYNCSDHRLEMATFLKANGFEPSETVGMMTAVILEDLVYRSYEENDFSIFIVVTAGVGNAIDASKSELHSFERVPGTINTWIFVNGELTEEAFIQSIMTATEAKVKAIHDLQVMDNVTGTIATGTSTDSILIAATQTGCVLEYAGTITPLGKLISKAVYQCTTEAIQKSQKRKKS
ncbi:ATP-binding cassette domain-containing protein [Bacillus salipaludis]|uniref:ATP-binding cassette domain-containing protein n=1 Tax=Bacillus salipaludis TaxID=2547811 RepID=A0A4R5VVM4_9BACI|nr:adenosylcobinamide amidohydrolase [Bacillus salipaludis]MDQ6597394.1 adenosylcobinamide amidohydrolase [Bacillus salipaludis]TDK63176.1 ATP-binding cassette domain-containing protein [Bacillus salipaludis]